MQELSEPREKAVLVGVDRGNTEWPMDESLAELARLTDTAGADVVGTVSQKLASPVAATFIGKGKAAEIEAMAQALDAGVIIFDDELTPSQQTNLEKVFKGRKVIDRTALILDIFGLHATSSEGRLQVRLAQNQYLYPRLRGMWAHLASNRMGGGVGSRFGEGESQLEVDRRIIRKRITSIRRELKDLEGNREIQRKSRGESGVFRVSLAGYTNAGKSSLLNCLTSADVLAYDQLFATLDSTTRKLILPEGREVTLTDTVGFIQKLPHNLIEAFKSTLDEITASDLILHVIDASSNMRAAQMQSVRDVLQEIGAASIPTIEVFNKSDLLEPGEKESLSRNNPSCVVISAKTGEGVDELIDRITKASFAKGSLLYVCIPFSRGDLVGIAHESCTVRSEDYSEQGTLMHLLVPAALVARFEEFVVEE